MYYLYKNMLLDNLSRIINNVPDSIHGRDIEWDRNTDDEDLVLKQKVVHSKIIEGLFKYF